MIISHARTVTFVESSQFVFNVRPQVGDEPVHCLRVDRSRECTHEDTGRVGLVVAHTGTHAKVGTAQTPWGNGGWYTRNGTHTHHNCGW